MNALSYKTISTTKANSVKEWIVVDADGHNLGRLASKVAMILYVLIELAMFNNYFIERTERNLTNTLMNVSIMASVLYC